MFNYLRQLTGKERSERHDAHLAQFLTFIAGAANAGGFMAFRQYTSHMTGIAASAADAMALGHFDVVISASIAILSFVSGAAISAILINWGRRKGLHSQYAFPLLLESLLLGCFGLLGQWLQTAHLFVVPMTVMVLCFIMGLQNAMITKLSGARIRTTHITGMVTDLGIELGKLVYLNRTSSGHPAVKADQAKMVLLALLILLFFTGGVIGAMGFNHFGFSSALFLSGLLLVLAVIPVVEDVIKHRHFP